MSLGLLFWILVLLAVLGGVPKVREKVPAWSGGLLTLALIAILGWAVFGPAIKG